MADKKVGRAEKAVELARKVGRPLTFFAAVGFLLIGLIPAIYAFTPNDAEWYIAITPAILSLMLGVDIVCVLLWAKTKLAKDPNAFKDES